MYLLKNCVLDVQIIWYMTQVEGNVHAHLPLLSMMAILVLIVSQDNSGSHH